ncbi:DUF4290 domain-containing protein [Cryomorpha ignava]|uniref:DUF4290 domain-containing protein n=1 Tax=Cryomorpha ignava TaxID=101383 RepID=A0A7K3WR71_9FLAO|nr:DUF4290 domain-containing protein [Cryomorpha ignava]NEN24028.1 DUF4290 domain-containing protein [Cryomorpha ignava]
MKITYNSARPDLVLPEYGRSIQNMVNFCVNIEDREERNKCAMSMISIMGNLFPHLRDIEDFKHKLWDHLHIMSDFQLDVDSPYPKPDRETFQEKPKRVAYPSGQIKYGHYGQTIEKIIDQVMAEEDEEKRKELAVSVANLMKRTYVVWNQNSVRDEVIANDLRKLSDGKLIVENPEEALASTKEVMQQMGVNTNTNTNKGKQQNRGRKRSNQGRKGPRKKRN